MSKQDIQSKEELYFEWWLQELQDNGYINNWAKAKTYELISSVESTYLKQLKTKSVETVETIERSHNYTPDYEIHWNKKAKDIFVQIINSNHPFNPKRDKNLFLQTINGICLVEVKGGFSLHGQLRNNSVDRKLMLEKHGIYVNLVKIPDLFKIFFTPQKYFLTDTGKQNRIIHFKTVNLEDYVSNPKWLNNCIEILNKTKELNK